MWPFINRLAGRPAPANPLPPQLDLAPARRVLVIAPHPDDESIGCGGTLARLAPRCEIQVVLVTNGDGAGELPPQTSLARETELAKALQTLGIRTSAICLDEPDGRFADSPFFQDRLREIVDRFAPNWVFLPWPHDSHADHAAVARASCRVLAHSAVELLLYYEVWTPLAATHVVDIGDTVAVKKAAIACHQTALQYGNYLEATLGLNAYRAIYLPRKEGPQWAEAFAVRPARDCGKV